MPASKPASKLCKCRAHCTTLNPDTGVYEGDGHLVSRGTLYNHGRDDKRLKASEKSRSSSLIEKIFSSGSHSPQSSSKRYPSQPTSKFPSKASLGSELDLKFMRSQLAWHLEVPVTSPSVPLVFNNIPASNGKYIRPSRDALIQPNSGLYSLKEKRCRKNAAFIAAEYHLSELASLLLTEGTSDEAFVLYQELLDELSRLNQQKEFHWEQQRGGCSPHVNTGNAISNPLSRIFSDKLRKKFTSTSKDHVTSLHERPLLYP